MQQTRAADTLTGGRLLIALLVALTLNAGWMGTTAVLLSLSWVSDFFDGRLARSATAESQLGEFDLAADTAVGAGMVVGLIGFGAIDWALGTAILGVLGVGYLVTGSATAAMALQGIGYGVFMWTAFGLRSPFWWLPIVVALGLLVLAWDTFVGRVLPSFLAGFRFRPRN